MGALLRAGVWTDHALRIDALLAQNRQRGYNRLPDLRDVLGWIAHCFAYQKKHRIQNPAAALSASLNANRRCPDALRPPLICQVCHCEEGHCACETPRHSLPPEFLDFAFSNRYDPHRQSFWCVCRRCHAYPCQCTPGEEGEEEEEERFEWPSRGDARGW